MGSQLSLPQGINKKLKRETKNKMMSVIGPVRFRYHEAVQMICLWLTCAQKLVTSLVYHVDSTDYQSSIWNQTENSNEK